jgi:uncharacterized membrane protein
MRSYVIAWVATAAAFLGVDAVWLSFAASRLYQPLLGDLLRETFLLAPAALFYVIYTIGIVIFAVAPSLASGRWTDAVLRGAVFGFVSYAVYDLTNQATLRAWPVTITVADLIWGTVLTAVAATAGFFAARAARG